MCDYGWNGKDMNRPSTKSRADVNPRTKAGRSFIEDFFAPSYARRESIAARILAIEAEAAAPALDVERLTDFDLAMLKATIVKEEQRRYALAHPDSDGAAR